MKMDMNLYLLHVLIFLVVLAILFFIVKIDRKLTVCPVTGEIPCKCNRN